MELSFKVTRKDGSDIAYKVSGDIEVQISNDDHSCTISTDYVDVYKNGEHTTDFGERFNGTRIDEQDFAIKAVAAYLNGEYGDNCLIHDMQVDDELRTIKENSFFTETISCGMEYPAYHTDGFFVAKLDFVAEQDGYIFVGYASPDYTVLIDDSDKSLITDMENFYCQALSEFLEDSDSVMHYVSDNVQAVIDLVEEENNERGTERDDV